MSDRILNAVPVGSQNAMSARDIWIVADIWAESTFANKLNALVDVGEVKRRRETVLRGYKHLYWREGAA